MKHTFFALLALTVSLFSCNLEKQRDEAQVVLSNVLEWQEKSKNTASDSTAIFLNKASQLLTTYLELPDSLRAENEYLLGRYFERENQLDSAVIHFHNSVQFVKDSIKSKKEVIYFRKAWETFGLTGDYGNAIAVNNRFILLLNKEKDFQRLGLAYSFLENVNSNLGNPIKALEFNKKSHLEFQKAKDSSNMAILSLSKAHIYYTHIRDKEGAFKILDSLVEMQQELSSNFKTQLFERYGILNFYEGDYQKAYDNYLKAITEAKKIEEIEDPSLVNHIITTQYANAAEVCIELKDYKTAQKYIDSVLRVGFKDVRPQVIQATLKYQLKLAYLINDNIDQTLSVFDTIYKYQNKIHQQKIDKELLALIEANENERQLLIDKQDTELDNIELKQNQNKLIAALSILSLLTAIGYLIFRQRKISFEKQHLQMHQRLLRSQMNPHFTLNILTIIQHLIKRNQDEAAHYLIKFSRLLGLILENSKHNYISLKDEMESVKNYLDLQSIRFPNRFSYHIEMTNEDDVLIPPMLIQPFVENSIEHGFVRDNQKGRIDIKLVVEQDFVLCTVADNGTGFKSFAGNEYQGSTKLIAKFLKKTTGKEIEYINKKDTSNTETGLIVKFCIPYKSSM
ncbi:MAG: histidine kinase [Bacteroidota bacterium]